MTYESSAIAVPSLIAVTSTGSIAVRYKFSAEKRKKTENTLDGAVSRLLPEMY